jgi:hypothetical protein
LRIVEAAERGVLSLAKCSAFAPDLAQEPPPQYAHWDFLVAHALHFRKLLKEEKEYHRKMAKILAREAYDFWKNKFKRKSEEEIEQEETERQILRYKQLVIDVKGAWAGVRLEIDKERVARWEEEQMQLGHKAMDDMFNQAKEILGRNVADTASSLVSDDRDFEEDFESGASDASETAHRDDVMSSSSDSEDGKTMTRTSRLSSSEQSTVSFPIFRTAALKTRLRTKRGMTMLGKVAPNPPQILISKSTHQLRSPRTIMFTPMASVTKMTMHTTGNRMISILQPLSWTQSTRFC